MAITIQKWGNSQGIRLPKYLLEAIRWQVNDPIEVKVEDDKIIIQKTVKRRKNIKELFADFDGQYTPTEMDWGKPKGKEIW